MTGAGSFGAGAARAIPELSPSCSSGVDIVALGLAEPVRQHHAAAQPERAAAFGLAGTAVVVGTDYVRYGSMAAAWLLLLAIRSAARPHRLHHRRKVPHHGRGHHRRALHTRRRRQYRPVDVHRAPFGRDRRPNARAGAAACRCPRTARARRRSADSCSRRSRSSRRAP
ncbi:hypothetical protein PsYK624_042530 [Phanerochaete sordida]|uniref:Uncharacterized protein n=1 Tax=Phanerochaete sordida TaxID=48140 RepID=A0A9P3G5Z0_9APHY|nr:hypothetical protein PsYK624_042530 [Phanerochaete sordida]